MIACANATWSPTSDAAPGAPSLASGSTLSDNSRFITSSVIKEEVLARYWDALDNEAFDVLDFGGPTEKTPYSKGNPWQERPSGGVTVPTSSTLVNIAIWIIACIGLILLVTEMLRTIGGCGLKIRSSQGSMLLSL